MCVCMCSKRGRELYSAVSEFQPTLAQGGGPDKSFEGWMWPVGQQLLTPALEDNWVNSTNE